MAPGDGPAEGAVSPGAGVMGIDEGRKGLLSPALGKYAAGFAMPGGRGRTRHLLKRE